MSRRTSKPTDSTASAFDREWQRWATQHDTEQTPPKGAITSERYAVIAKTNKIAAHARLKYAAAQGKLKTGMFRVRCVDGFIRAVRHWWRP